MMETSVTLEFLERIALPIFTLIGGWFAHLIRSKQKKEADILDNMKQILDMQSKYIAQQDVENRRTRDINVQLEQKLDDKRASIRQANKCKYSNEGDGCPVLSHEEATDDRCKTCNIRKNVDGED